MRVIGGTLRSRRIRSLPGLDVRPTPDRLRETLFDILAPRIPGTVFGDLYAGAGSVGIEALSRGAARAVFVEYGRAATRVLRENLRELDLEARAEVHQGRAAAILARLDPMDIVFLDPPYRLDLEYERTLSLLGAHPPGLVVVQHDVRRQLGASCGDLRLRRSLKQGDNALSFFEP